MDSTKPVIVFSDNGAMSLIFWGGYGAKATATTAAKARHDTTDASSDSCASTQQ